MNWARKNADVGSVRSNTPSDGFDTEYAAERAIFTVGYIPGKHGGQKKSNYIPDYHREEIPSRANQVKPVQ